MVTRFLNISVAMGQLASSNRRRLREAANRGYVTRDITENDGAPLVEVRKLASRGGFDRVSRGAYRRWRRVGRAYPTGKVSSVAVDDRLCGPARTDPAALVFADGSILAM